MPLFWICIKVQSRHLKYRNMITFEIFCNLTNRNFSFLEKDFNYLFKEFNNKNNLYQQVFIKKDNMIVVEYSKKNEYLSVIFYKDIYRFQPTTQDGVNSTSLDYLIRDKNKRKVYVENDYDIFMPFKIGEEKSFKMVSGLLLEYGNEILNGKKWKGWAEK
jgi:hypothetical protein